MARPNPVAPPVTTATLPGKSGPIACGFGSGSIRAEPDGRDGRGSQSGRSPGPEYGLGLAF
jgi:hypothetical protein